jgi:hypothetical protein
MRIGDSACGSHLLYTLPPPACLLVFDQHRRWAFRLGAVSSVIRNTRTKPPMHRTVLTHNFRTRHRHIASVSATHQTCPPRSLPYVHAASLLFIVNLVRVAPCTQNVNPGTSSRPLLPSLLRRAAATCMHVSWSLGLEGARPQPDAERRSAHGCRPSRRWWCEENIWRGGRREYMEYL